MARPRNARLPLPTVDQLYDGLEVTRQSASGLLANWLEQDGAEDDDGHGEVGNAARHADGLGANGRAPGVLPDGTPRPPRSRIYTASSNGDGQTSHVRAKVPAVTTHMLGALIARGDIPGYHTIGDFVRDAMLHRMWDVAEGLRLEPEDVEKMKMLEAEQARVEWEERVERNDKVVEGARVTLRRLCDRPGLRGYLAMLKRTAGHVDPPWRQELLDLVAHYER